MKKIAVWLFFALSLFFFLPISVVFSDEFIFAKYGAEINKVQDEIVAFRKKQSELIAEGGRLKSTLENYKRIPPETGTKANAIQILEDNIDQLDKEARGIEDKIEEKQGALKNIQAAVGKSAQKGLEAIQHAEKLQQENFYEALADRYKSLNEFAIPREFTEKLTDVDDFKKDAKAIDNFYQSLIPIEALSRENKDRFLTLFKTGEGSQFKAAFGGLNEALTSVKLKISAEEKALKGESSESKKKTNEENLKRLQLRKETLETALESGNPKEDKTYDDLEEQIAKRKEEAVEIHKLRKGGLSEARAEELLSRLRGQTPSVEQSSGSCLADPEQPLGSSLKGFFTDTLPSGVSKVGGWLSEVPDGIVKLDDIATQYGGAAKLGLFSIFSALSQYQYTQRGSKNSQTQVFRAMAIVLGQDMGLKGQLPRGLEGLVDPLKPFKRQPIALQQRLDSQERILDSVLTIGGDPSRPGGFPSGTHEQLQRILKGSVFPGGVPDFQLPPSFPGVYDPNFVNFSRQSFNGFPPFPTTKTRGALLNPGFASNNPFAQGSGASSNNFKTVSQSEGVTAVANVTAATAVVKEGVEDFASQLENINPQDNSLKSLIDDIPGREARAIALRGRKNDLSSLLAHPGEARLLDLQREQATLIIQKQNEIAQRNKEIFEATLEFRKQDFYVQPDEDGLMPAGGRDFSKRFAKRTDALIRIQELTRRRAAEIEALALIRNNLPLFKRFQEGGGPGPFFQPSFGLLKYFTIKSLLAEEKKGIFVPNWREIAQDELQKTDREIEGNRQKLRTDLSHLRSLVALDPDGVHEINAEVVQMEKFNMKMLAWQAKDNLRKLEKAESDVAIDVTLTEEKKKEIRSDLESYKAAFSKLEKAADSGANELWRVERLQREKMERSDMFDYYQKLGKQLIVKYRPQAIF